MIGCVRVILFCGGMNSFGVDIVLYLQSTLKCGVDKR